MRLLSSLPAWAGATTLYTLSIAAHLPTGETDLEDRVAVALQPTAGPSVTFTPNYVSAGVRVSVDANASCHVTLSVTAPNPNQGDIDCGYVDSRTSYVIVTRSTLLIDCYGCDGPLTVQGSPTTCPPGRTTSPYQTTVTDVVSTAYAYECTSTITRTLSVPRVAGPPYTPAALSVVSAAGGPCTAILSVAPTASDQLDEECRAGATPTVWPRTVTSEVPIDCGGCGNLAVNGLWHGCPVLPSEGSTVSAETPSTLWNYACAASPTPNSA